jgi:phospholipid/cholesterol/gamma-HCH transport system substrate-binding protein
MSRITGVLRRQRGAVVGITIFTAMALVVTALIAGTLIGSSGRSESYEAVFRNASGIAVGDDVRISGVRVGKVEEVGLDGVNARVKFSVSVDQKVYKDTTATVEFLNLLGQRFIHLETETRGEELTAGSTIPISNTREGLDLSAVFNAFRPLFEMIKPEDVNELATEITHALQGQGGSLRHLAEQTARLTGHLEDRDKVIGAVIEQLTVVMETMDEHRGEFRSMITELNGLTGTIAKNRDQVGATIDAVQAMVSSFASLLAAGGDSVVRDIDALAAWTQSFASVAPQLGARLKDTQLLMTGYIKSLGLGSYLNVYVCESKVKLGGAPVVDLSLDNDRSWRCKR